MNDAVEAVGSHTDLLPGFWSSDPLLLQCGCPGLAALLWLLALLQLALFEVATDEQVAMLIATLAAVLTGYADHTALSALLISVGHEAPSLHRSLLVVHRYSM